MPKGKVRKATMMICPVCGIGFTRIAPRQIYCSERCYHDAANERAKARRGTGGYMVCVCCNKKVKKTAPNQKYCLKCADFMKRQAYKEKNETDKDKRHAAKAMSEIKTGKLDEMQAECRRRGISYAQLQQEMTLEKIRKGEL